MQKTATGKQWRRRGGTATAFQHPRLPVAINRLLSNRGLRSVEEAESFLRGDLDREHDPNDLPNIEAALRRIAGAVRDGELIAVFGDYDVDGVTGTAILVEGISALGGRVIPYLPHRFTEGYGVNNAALSDLRGRGVSLVITVDCGISNAEEVDFANEIGLDVVVVDHHEVPARVPAAVALVDPKLDGCRYPCTELAACGVAFKLLIALSDFLGRPYDPEQHLDLVALGTVCDMAPLRGENRSLVRKGLRSLRRTRRPGLRALAAASGSDLSRADAETLGFRLGPRLNAAGRLDHARLAYELVTTHDQQRAEELARQLDRLNAERQRLTAIAVEISQGLVDGDQAGAPLLMIGHAEISQGIVGLVASRLADTYNRPAIVYERGEETCRGSARSIAQFNIVEALQQAQPLLTRFGGHRQAGGFSAPTRNIEALREQLIAWAGERLATEDLTPVLEYDDDLDLDSYGAQEFKWMSFLEPFGLGNPEPLFVARGLTVVESRAVGADSTHLKLRLRSANAVWPAIAFGLAHASSQNGAKIDALIAIKLDDRGRPDLHVKDFAPS